MQYFQIDFSDLDTAEFLEATDAQQAAWLRLSRYCGGQENGGRIEGASEWTDRKWRNTVRTAGKLINAPSPLWQFEEGDLLVHFYPLASELACNAQRKGGSKGGKARWAKAKAKAQADTTPPGSPIGSLEGTHEGEPIRKDVCNGSNGSKVGDGRTAAAAIPPLDEVIEASLSYPGSTPLGIKPGAMPKDWVEHWYRWQLESDRGFPVRQWFRIMVLDFENDVSVKKHPRALGTLENKTPAAPGGSKFDVFAAMRAVPDDQPSQPPQNP